MLPASISYLCWSTCWCRPTLRLFSVSASAPASLHDFTVKNIDGEQVEHNIYCLDGQNAFLQVDLAVYKGRACVVVNVASKYFTLLTSVTSKDFLWTWLWVNLVLKSSHRDWLQNKRLDSKVRKDKGQLRSAGDPVQAGVDQEIISIFTVSSAYWLNIKPEKKYWFGILSSLSRDVSVRWRSW